MQLKIYPEEKFERSRKRYTAFFIIVTLILILSIIKDNLYGALILIAIAGIYLYFHIHSKKTILLEITPQGIKIGEKIIAWINLKGFVLEMEKETLKLKNIVLLYQGGKHEIYTLADDIESIHTFSETLEKYIPHIGSYEQSFGEKLFRKMKL